MPKSGNLVFFTLAFLLVSVHLGRGQTSVDELGSSWQLGSLRGHVILRISDSEEESFGKFINRFTDKRSFTRVSSRNKTVFSGRQIILEWYRRQDGVTILVTNLTAPEKMRVVFYDKKGGVGAVEAEQTFLEFEALSSRFRRYE